MGDILLLADTRDISFSKDSITFTILSGALMAVIPVVFFIVMRKFTKFKVKPMITGAVVWFIFAILLKVLLLTPVIGMDNSVSKAVKGNVWLYYFVAASAAGIFEETGRFIAFRTVLKRCDDKSDALSYGLGHGGFESVYIGIQVAFLGIMAAMVNKGGIESVAKGADDSVIDSLLAQMDKLMSGDIGHALLVGYERIPAVLVHIVFSVIVFAAVRQRKTGLYFLAVFLHFAVDFSLVLYYAKIVSLGVTEIIFTLEAILIAVLTNKLLYKKLYNISYERKMADGISGNI
ncbi:MAG: YhfC family intramembrane metalloprotease [Ruminococcus sp.]|uniref:YhfC family intramembrane metalloprotease n=1 Tax=Ruminococcus sp. TaxID=41978 RepID=UPI0025E53FB0|nr:YhfC family glutamic-type intramembrane protease [Ruminococcus sp.]MCR5541976.1 YhfC family intramembrane metalloprotease [Ruminococcus sp.]